MIRAAIILAALALTACTNLPERARTSLPGTTLPDLIACAGPPAEKMRVGDDDYVLVLTPQTISTPTVSGSVSVLDGLAKPTVTASASMTCKVIARVQRGRVLSLHYVGSSSLFVGAHAACRPVVADCLAHPDRTALGAGYRDADWLSPTH